MSIFQSIRQRDTAQVRIGLALATFAVAGLLGLLMLSGRGGWTEWSGGIGLLALLGLWMLRRGLRSRPR